MKLLFITQKVDKDDDILGVYHRWIEELAKRVEKISVICLYRGRVELPDNVHIYSLGKEDNFQFPCLAGRQAIFNFQSIFNFSIFKKIKYVVRFCRYLWKLRHDYDRVLVHMNPEYMVLGGLFWKIFGKKPILWYNHPMGDLKARIAIALADKVLHTSPFAFAARYKKAEQMPVGIDTGLFRRIPEIHRKPTSILYLGRISPIKYIEILIGAAFILEKRGVDFVLTIAGKPSKESEIAYADSIKKQAEPLVKKGKVMFTNGVPNYKTPELYNANAISVNMTPTGSFDKTIIEAMACESLVVASNKAVSDILPESFRFREKDPDDLAKALEIAIALPEQESRKIGASLRNYVLGRHDLGTLIKRLVEKLGGGN